MTIQPDGDIAAGKTARPVKVAECGFGKKVKP